MHCSIQAASWALVASLVSACRAEGGGGDELASLPEWTTSTEPSAVLAEDGRPETQFIRITGVARLANGDLLVADQGSKELRIFRDGLIVTRLSRQGDGPGELQDLTTITISADTIFVIASALVGRGVINTFTVANGFTSRYRLQFAEGVRGYTPTGRLTSGQYVVQTGQGPRALTTPPEAGKVVPDSVSIGMFQPTSTDSTGTMIPLGRFRRQYQVGHPWPGGRIPTALSGFPLGHRMLPVVAGDLLWIGDTESGALRAFDGQGRMVVDDTLPGTPVPFNANALQRARQVALAAADNDYLKAAAEAAYNASLLPATMPRFDLLVAGHDGALWVRRFELEPGATRQYVIIDPSGMAIARIVVPADVIIQQVGPDFLLGLRRDADGVESVVEYRLLKP